ncbi:MAG TPA: TspO/MBR family protein [Acetobacteraceae bacterium]|nr:TspO/MBR family protein [Acetobacteraceae bacterium]
MTPVLALVGFVGLCLLVFATDSALASAAFHGWYLSLTRPPGTPPRWVFGPIWAVLYISMGVAAWLVWQRAVTNRPLRLWGWQLALNALWPTAFFALHSQLFGLAVILVLIPLLVLTIRSFAAVNRAAAWLVVPYLAWSGYALYLDAGFCLLNPG